MRTRALLTRMDTPLGRAVGNAVEVEESVAALQGDGPADLMEVTLALAAQMLALAGLDADPAAAIADGRALAAYRAMFARPGRGPGRPAAAGGAHPGCCPRPRRLGVPAWTPWRWAPRPGGSARAGPARKTRSSAAAGMICLAKPGTGARGQPLLELRADDEALFAPPSPPWRRRHDQRPEPAAPVRSVIEHIGPLSVAGPDQRAE